MIDFSKLLDPAHMARVKAEREAESARQEAESKRTWSAVTALGNVEGHLSDTERRFVNNCRRLVSQYSVLTPKQLDWLFNLADRFAPAWQGPAAEPAPEPENEGERSAPSP